MISKKAQSLSISTIILIAIGLLVLIIIAILIYRSGGSADEATSCIKRGGVCKMTACPGYEVVANPGEKMCGLNQYCCSPVRTR